ncbi:MAG: hypothetical protein R3E44_16115 [Paracoccaceae bacterium]
MRRLVSIIVAVVAGLMLMAGAQYYLYATNTDSPYDEIGIMLTGYMPAPVRDWGCGKLHQTFGNVVPPYGCARADNPQIWR